jgi:hypothetical protein
MNIRGEEAKLLRTIIDFLHRVSKRKGLEEAAIHALDLDNELRQAVIDGKTYAQRGYGHKDRRNELKISDDELAESLRILRAGRANLHKRMADPREER